MARIRAKAGTTGGVDILSSSYTAHILVVCHPCADGKVALKDGAAYGRERKILNPGEWVFLQNSEGLQLRPMDPSESKWVDCEVDIISIQ